MDWVEIEKVIGTVLSKMIRGAPMSPPTKHTDIPFTSPEQWELWRTHTAKIQAVKDVYVMLHAMAGRNGCAEKCWQKMIDDAEVTARA